MMRLIGSFMIGHHEQRQLVAGGTLDVDRSRIQPRKLVGASIGDLFWLKEPWTLAASRTHGPQNIRQAVPGPIGTAPPSYIAAKYHLLRRQPMSALCLERGDSRITLEIMDMNEHAFRFLVHFQQVDDFLKARSAA